jgi:hypothetical protein
MCGSAIRYNNSNKHFSVGMEKQQWLAVERQNIPCCGQPYIILGSSIKVPVVLTDFNQIWAFSADLNKRLQNQVLVKEFSGGQVDTCEWMEGKENEKKKY